MPDDGLTTEKQALRREAMARRDALDDDLRCVASRRALLALLRVLPLQPGGCVAAFWPLGRELDTRPLFAALTTLGVACCLPRMTAKGQPLAFHRYRPGDTLLEGAMRVLEPLAEAPVCCPDCVVVPLLAFDRRGVRLGYGGGFYDRTLAQLGADVPALGLAFAAQEVPSLPAGPSDVRLRTVVTDAGVRVFD